MKRFLKTHSKGPFQIPEMHFGPLLHRLDEMAQEKFKIPVFVLMRLFLKQIPTSIVSKIFNHKDQL